MDTALKAAGFAIVGAVLALTVRRGNPGSALLLSAAVCLGLTAAALVVVGPVVDFARQLQNLSGLSDSVTAPLFKTLAIAIVTNIASSVCSDAGEASIAKGVELCGALLALYAALPLMSGVTKLIGEML